RRAARARPGTCRRRAGPYGSPAPASCGRLTDRRLAGGTRRVTPLRGLVEGNPLARLSKLRARLAVVTPVACLDEDVLQRRRAALGLRGITRGMRLQAT